MERLQEYVDEYKKQMEKGTIQRAYRGIMQYIMDLRTHFSKKFPDFAPGNIYYGYMDMTYFPIFPILLKEKKLKIAIVLIHETVRFEVWLAGANKQVQEKYWNVFKEGDWTKYRIPATIKGVDSIIEYTLVNNPDFDDLASLTRQIEEETLVFIGNIEGFLSKN
jgi:hypothetical protein